MTLYSYRNQLERQMLSYLRYMRYTTSDQELQDLQTEVERLKQKVQFLDLLPGSKLAQEAIFKVEVFESYGVNTEN